MKRSVTLAPIFEREDDYDAIEAIIDQIFREEIYYPLVREAGAPKTAVIQNAKDDLRAAILKGRVSFYRGQFSGKFNATLSKELKGLGATFNKQTKTWDLSPADLPDQISHAVGVADSRFQRMMKQVDAKLDSLAEYQIRYSKKLERQFNLTLDHVDQDVKESMRKKLVVGPDLDDKGRQLIAQEYTTNMELYIQKFASEEVIKLRQDIQQAAYSGNRYESLIETIQQSYGVSARKAKFLARQETSIMMSTFKEARYRAAGSTKYIWKTVVGSPNHPVRPMHKALDGKVISWDSPPITAPNGARNHAGRDFGCRCSSRPVIDFRS